MKIKEEKNIKDINEDNIIIEEDDTEYNIADDYNIDMYGDGFEDFPLSENEDNHL